MKSAGSPRHPYTPDHDHLQRSVAQPKPLALAGLAVMLPPVLTSEMPS